MGQKEGQPESTALTRDGERRDEKTSTGCFWDTYSQFMGKDNIIGIAL
jgi:hypothetical protein